MSLATGYVLQHGELKLVGYSIAGTSTSIAFPEADVLFDVAQGLPYQTPYNTVLLTHAHMDHASGLPYLISQKSMQQRPKPVIYMPKAAIDPLTRLMDIWHEIDEYKYSFEFRHVAFGEEIPLKAGYFAKAFPTYHRIPSQGYTVYRRRRRLKAQYQDLAKT
ncbi:MAG: MBL fold metallo-hydrolase, partial [Bdellovibrionales bacterium]|nr:MBL fold metallo-hydrolase [Bdellovibrionales bacterium]